MVTGAHQNQQKRDSLHRKTTVDNLTTSDYDQPIYNADETDKTHLMKAITEVTDKIQKKTQKQKLIQTRVATFKGQKERHNEIEHFLLKPLLPFQKLNEKKFEFFTNPVTEIAI